MNPLLDECLSETKLGEEERDVLKELLLALEGLRNLEIKSVVLYGSAVSDAYRPGRSDVNVLFLVSRIDAAVLKALVEPVAKSRRGSLAPFFLTESDLIATVDVFPLKYMAMKCRYRLLAGTDFLANLEIRTDYANLRVRQRLANMLLRMRRYYLINNGHGLAAMMSQQGKLFIETLGILLRLRGHDSRDEEAIIAASTDAFGLSNTTLREVCRLRDAEGIMSREDEEALFGRFLDTVHQAFGQLDDHGRDGGKA